MDEESEGSLVGLGMNGDSSPTNVRRLGRDRSLLAKSLHVVWCVRNKPASKREREREMSTT